MMYIDIIDVYRFIMSEHNGAVILCVDLNRCGLE